MVKERIPRHLDSELVAIKAPWKDKSDVSFVWPTCGRHFKCHKKTKEKRKKLV